MQGRHALIIFEGAQVGGGGGGGGCYLTHSSHNGTYVLFIFNRQAGSSHDPLQSPAVASGAVSKPGGDAAGQDALHSAGVEGPEDSGARSKLPQPS